MPEVVLAVDGLAKRFGDVQAVHGVSFEVRAGEIFGLLGPNGAGKTTTIRLICGLLTPDAGRVLVRGQPLAASAEGRARVGLCPHARRRGAQQDLHARGKRRRHRLRAGRRRGPERDLLRRRSASAAAGCRSGLELRILEVIRSAWPSRAPRDH